jgi:hypothetical protein
MDNCGGFYNYSFENTRKKIFIHLLLQLEFYDS